MARLFWPMTRWQRFKFGGIKQFAWIQLWDCCDVRRWPDAPGVPNCICLPPAARRILSVSALRASMQFAKRCASNLAVDPEQPVAAVMASNLLLRRAIQADLLERCGLALLLASLGFMPCLPP